MIALSSRGSGEYSIGHTSISYTVRKSTRIILAVFNDINKTTGDKSCIFIVVTIRFCAYLLYTRFAGSIRKFVGYVECHFFGDQFHKEF